VHVEGDAKADISAYQGISRFSRAYRVMAENDTHAPGSVDRVLLNEMVRLCPETAGYLYNRFTPTKVSYKKGTRPVLEKYVEEISSACNNEEELVDGVARFTSGLGEAADVDIDSMLFGGTEEEIIERGSDWCTDVARVGCILCQVVGLPSRIVYLADTEKAYHGHAIIEVFRAGAWGAVDSVTSVVYRHPSGKPASTLDLMNSPDLINAHYTGKLTYYSNPGQFREAAVSNYFVSDWKNYDYTVSRVNPYQRSILEMSDKGWPGGFRWLHGEEEQA